jgi:hypothetical protein
MRKLFGKGTPRGFAAARAGILSAAIASIRLISVPARLVRKFGAPLMHAETAQMISVTA